uniref:Uncharacterized protein n=1 Tax=Podoviridae sp. ctrub15 TaxID=2826581 RepID=A0A8S5LV02_9CAUD|nr:MAG TPA: hypothetical protein [Podoviridae sp. ctrub15]
MSTRTAIKPIAPKLSHAVNNTKATKAIPAKPHAVATMALPKALQSITCRLLSARQCRRFHNPDQDSIDGLTQSVSQVRGLTDVRKLSVGCPNSDLLQVCQNSFSVLDSLKGLFGFLISVSYKGCVCH